MIATSSLPRTYPIEVYRLQAGLRHRRRERAASVTADSDGGGKSRIPRSRLSHALREELDTVAATMFGRDPMPIPNSDDLQVAKHQETPMYLQLVAPDPDANTGLDAATLCAEAPNDEPTPAATQPGSRTEWRALVEAKCAERGIRLADACREMGLSFNFFSPSQLSSNIRPRLQRTIQEWLDREAPAAEPIPPVRCSNIEALPGAEVPAPAALEYSYTGPVPDLPPSPKPAPRRPYPAISVAPASMPIEELITYLMRLEDVMPGATVMWATSLSISQEQSQ